MIFEIGVDIAVDILISHRMQNIIIAPQIIIYTVLNKQLVYLSAFLRTVIFIAFCTEN